MIITNPRNPQWANAENTLIDVVVAHAIYGEIPFSASQTDTEPHGGGLFSAALSGEFGPIAPYSAPVKTSEQIKKELEQAIQNFMDSKAQIKGYDNIKSAALRAGYPGPFHDEGVAYATWMDSCWSTCYGIMAEVQAGTRQVPTADELIQFLPALTLAP